jgi:uncharacterized iron-regulated protein
MSMIQPTGPAVIADAPVIEAVRDLPMFDGRTGAALGWSDLLGAIDRSDIIILGEQHDDALGHAVQRAVVTDVCARPQRAALSLEMLERDEQLTVDDFADGIITAEQLARLTQSEDWGGKGKWREFYQPTIDAALAGDARVVAANAPRRYVRLARMEGYDRLASLPPARRALFDLPREIPDGAYRDRFFGLMMPSPDESADDRQDAEADDAHGHSVTLEDVEATFRSQLVWDATMAESIARTHRSDVSKVVHLVGQFHSDFEGGLVQEIRHRARRATVLAISLQRAWPGALREEDRNRADIVIYTGEREPEQEPADAPAAESADSAR